ASDTAPTPSRLSSLSLPAALPIYAQRCGYRLFTADPHVGGRYSALTAFGLVPSGLAGADITALLDEAADAAPVVTEDSQANPARSEEHTSELQSRFDLVCRPLLAK